MKKILANFQSDHGGIEISSAGCPVQEDRYFQSDHGGIEILKMCPMYLHLGFFLSDHGGIEIGHQPRKWIRQKLPIGPWWN